MEKQLLNLLNKSFLVTPGPTPCPESVRLKMAQQLIHHRTPEFSTILGRAQEGLAWLYQTKELPLILTCSGTGAFEGAMQTFTAAGESLVAIGGGKFGERWGEMGKALGMEVKEVKVEWGRCVSEEDLLAALNQGAPDLITLSVSETSTGVLHDLEMVVRVAKEMAPDALIGVDAVTALGVHNLPFDELGIDFMVAGSQKALGLPPGLGFVVASQRAWERAQRLSHASHGRRSYYFNLLNERSKQQKQTTAFTPALTLVIGLDAVFDLLREEGLERIFERHARTAQFCREGLTKLGFTLFAEVPSDAVTAAVVPEGVDAVKLVKRLESEYCIKIAGGQEHLKGRMIRVGHLGFIDVATIAHTLTSIETLLEAL